MAQTTYGQAEPVEASTAFIEAHDDEFDAMELSLDRGVNRFSFPSLGDAVAHFASLDVNQPEQRTRVSSPGHAGGIL